jgi:hypothetical protein
MVEAELHAQYLLKDYRSRASLIVTPLHHAATPCLSSGIPVILCRQNDNTRFSYLREILPLHLPPAFPSISWDAAPTDIDAVRAALIDLLKDALERV